MEMSETWKHGPEAETGIFPCVLPLSALRLLLGMRPWDRECKRMKTRNQKV